MGKENGSEKHKTSNLGKKGDGKDVRAGGGERERQTDRQTDRQTETERQRQREVRKGNARFREQRRRQMRQMKKTSSRRRGADSKDKQTNWLPDCNAE